jgi:hypothetical protein
MPTPACPPPPRTALPPMSPWLWSGCFLYPDLLSPRPCKSFHALLTSWSQAQCLFSSSPGPTDCHHLQTTPLTWEVLPGTYSHRKQLSHFNEFIWFQRVKNNWIDPPVFVAAWFKKQWVFPPFLSFFLPLVFLEHHLVTDYSSCAVHLCTCAPVQVAASRGPQSIFSPGVSLSTSTQPHRSCWKKVSYIVSCWSISYK